MGNYEKWSLLFKEHRLIEGLRIPRPRWRKLALICLGDRERNSWWMLSLTQASIDQTLYLSNHSHLVRQALLSHSHFIDAEGYWGLERLGDVLGSQSVGSKTRITSQFFWLKNQVLFSVLCSWMFLGLIGQGSIGWKHNFGKIYLAMMFRWVSSRSYEWLVIPCLSGSLD